MAINQRYLNIGSEFAGADQFTRKLLQKSDFVRKTPNLVLIGFSRFCGGVEAFQWLIIWLTLH